MNATKATRRGILAAIAAALGGLFLFRQAQGSGGTPSATEGPFYPTSDMRTADTDNDLVKIEGRVREAGGEIIILKGTVSDKDGNGLEGVRIEIWQCDAGGKYMHPGDNRDIVHDKGFQGFGHDITDENGGYRFRTIKPVSYPGRTPHIHVKLLDGKRELLTTQFYIRDHPDNQGDSLFRRMSDEDAATVTMDFTGGPEGSETTVDVVV